MKIAILTGASSGLGRAFAGKIHEVFPEIEEIWLVARRTERLEALAAETNAVRMVPVPCDLLNEESYRSLIGRLQAGKAGGAAFHQQRGLRLSGRVRGFQ